MHFVARQRVGEIAHSDYGVGRILAVGKQRDELLERAERFLGHLRIALGEILLDDVAEQPLVFAEVDQALQIVRVVDVRVVGVGADEAIAGRDRSRGFAGAVIRVGAFEDRLLRVASVRKTTLERVEQLDRPRIIAGRQHGVRFLVQVLGCPVGCLVLDFGQQIAGDGARRERDHDDDPNPQQRHSPHCCDSGGSREL